MKAILWFLRTFEDDNGNPDHKRITGFAFCMLIGYMVIFDKISTMMRLYAFLALLISVLVLYGIVKSQDIITFRRGYEVKPPDPVKTEINTTITTKP